MENVKENKLHVTKCEIFFTQHHVHPDRNAYLQDLNDLQLSVHHHDVLVVCHEECFTITQGGWAVGKTVGHSPTHHHLSHHFSNTMDGAQDIIA